MSSRIKLKNQHHKSITMLKFLNSINLNVIANYPISNGAEEITNDIDSSALVMWSLINGAYLDEDILSRVFCQQIMCYIISKCYHIL